MHNNPVQKLGIDTPINEKTLVALSKSLSLLTADIIPSGTEISKDVKREAIDNLRV